MPAVESSSRGSSRAGASSGGPSDRGRETGAVRRLARSTCEGAGTIAVAGLTVSIGAGVGAGADVGAWPGRAGEER